MEEKDILFRIRNSFFLGNYHRVYDIWKEGVNLQYSPGTLFEIITLLARAYTKLAKSNPDLVSSFAGSVSQYQDIFQLYNKYISLITQDVIN